MTRRRRRYGSGSGRRNPPQGWDNKVPENFGQEPYFNEHDYFTGVGGGLEDAWKYHHKRVPQLKPLVSTGFPVPYIKPFNPRSFRKLLLFMARAGWRPPARPGWPGRPGDGQGHGDYTAKLQLPQDLNELVRTDVVKYALRVWCTFGTDWVAWRPVIEEKGVHDSAYWLPRCAEQTLAVHPDIEDAIYARAHKAAGLPLVYAGLKRYLIKYRDMAASFGRDKHDQTGADILEDIVKNWPTLPYEARGLPPRKLDEWLYRRSMTEIQKVAAHEGLMAEAIRFRVPPEEYQGIERAWLGGLTRLQGLTGRPNEGTIPFVEVRHGPYKMYRLKKADPRGIFLGEYTDCCQHPLGEGDTSAWYGHENLGSAFFVVEDTHTGQIVAQSWAWAAEEDLDIPSDSYDDVAAVSTLRGLVFDSIEWPNAIEQEAEKAGSTLQYDIRQIYIDMGEKLVEDGYYDQVIVGQHPLDEHIGHTTASGFEIFYHTPSGDTYIYSDAESEQEIIAGPAPFDGELAVTTDTRSPFGLWGATERDWLGLRSHAPKRGVFWSMATAMFNGEGIVEIVGATDENYEPGETSSRISGSAAWNFLRDAYNGSLYTLIKIETFLHEEGDASSGGIIARAELAVLQGRIVGKAESLLIRTDPDRAYLDIEDSPTFEEAMQYAAVELQPLVEEVRRVDARDAEEVVREHERERAKVAAFLKEKLI